MTVTIPEPAFSPMSVPTLPNIGLSDAERQLVSSLLADAWRHRQRMLLTDAYYRGEQIVTNLRIAIPKELEFLRTIVGWPRVAVDPLVERLSADQFRLPGQTEANPDLQDIWLANGMDSDQSLLFNDCFVKGRGWITVGADPDGGATMCVESPLNVAAQWDVRSRKPSALLQSYWFEDRRHCVLMTPSQTIHLDQDEHFTWQLTSRDVHNFGLVPAVRISNRTTTERRDGEAEITNEVMSLTDAACRTLLGLEIAREFYSVPQKIILGATEADFQNPDGTQKTAWDAYITRVLALERTKNGDLPDIKQFKPYDPSVFTKIIEMLAGQVGGIIAANPQELGLYTEGNPVSADAQQSIDSRRCARARHKQRMFSAGLREAMQIAVRFANNGRLPAQFKAVEVDWMDPADLNLAAVTDAMQKQAQMGAVSPTSDVVAKRLGWTEVERAQIRKDLAADAAQQTLAEVADSLVAKEARTNGSVVNDLTPPAP